MMITSYKYLVIDSGVITILEHHVTSSIVIRIRISFVPPTSTTHSEHLCATMEWGPNEGTVNTIQTRTMYSS
jgi:hypothetical protein